MDAQNLMSVVAGAVTEAVFKVLDAARVSVVPGPAAPAAPTASASPVPPPETDSNSDSEIDLGNDDNDDTVSLDVSLPPAASILPDPFVYAPLPAPLVRTVSTPLNASEARAARRSTACRTTPQRIGGVRPDRIPLAPHKRRHEDDDTHIPRSELRRLHNDFRTIREYCSKLTEYTRKFCDEPEPEPEIKCESESEEEI